MSLEGMAWFLFLWNAGVTNDAPLLPSLLGPFEDLAHCEAAATIQADYPNAHPPYVAFCAPGIDQHGKFRK